MRRILFLLLLLCGTAHAQSNFFNSLTLNISGGTPDFYLAPATPALHTVTSASGHIVAGILCQNIGSSVTYLHLYNTTTVTIGTTAATAVIPCGPTAPSGISWAPLIGANYGGTAIAYYVSGGISTTDNTSITVSQTAVNIVIQ